MNETKSDIHFHVLITVGNLTVNDYITDRIGASEMAIRFISNLYFWDGEETKIYNKTSKMIGSVEDEEMYVRLVEPDVAVNAFITYCDEDCTTHPCMS